MELMRKLPLIDWVVDENLTITANDFMVVYQIASDWFNRTDVQFDVYAVSETDTPESLADRAYGDPTMYWAILIANRIVDRRTEWMMTHNQLLNYIFDKYYLQLFSPVDGTFVFDEELSARKTYEHLRFVGDVDNNWTAQYYYDENGGIVECQPHHFENENGDWIPFGAEGGIPVSIYDYEFQKNVNRRYIRIPSKDLVEKMKRAL